MAKERSGRGRAGTGAAVAVLVLAALLGGRYGLGLGGGKGGEGLLPESGSAVQGEAAEATAAPEAAPAEATEQEASGQEADDGVLTVTVREDKLFYEDEETDLAALEEALLRDYVPGVTDVKLIDDHAIKSAYDEVTALLERLGIEVG